MSKDACIFLNMVVVNLMKIILVNHFLKVLLHTLLTQIVRWIHLMVSCDYLGVLQAHVGQLVAQG